MINETHGYAQEAIDLDVLIIGGGVQGLWLLNDLYRLGYSVLLLERRELGGEQTCHSHVYIHQGHLYREGQESLAERLRGVNRLWTDWINTHTTSYGNLPSYFGFQNPGDADKREALWKHLELSYKRVSPPPVLSGSNIRTVFESTEICLDGESLIKELRRDVEDHISLIRRVERISVQISDSDRGSNKVEQVLVSMPQGQRLIFRPAVLILAAGAGNQALLELASGGHRSMTRTMRESQQIRKAHMLVIKGQKDCLKPLTGVFPDLGGLFIVSREREDEVVWLVSDDRSPQLSFIEDWMEYDTRWWLQRVFGSLQRLAPSCFDNAESRRRQRWGVYEAPKAEGRASGELPHEERIEKFQFKNLWAVWPTKLTLAPKVSDAVTSKVQDLIDPSDGWTMPAAWNEARKAPDTAPERWRKTQLVPFDEFRHCFGIDYN